jgi:hypothetical protein
MTAVTAEAFDGRDSAGRGWIPITWGAITVSLLAVGEMAWPPTRLDPTLRGLLVVIGLVTGTAYWTARGLRRPAVQGRLARWPVATATSLLLAAALVLALLDSALMILLWLFLAFAVPAALVLALVRLRRHPVDSSLGLGLLVALVATVTFPGLQDLRDVGTTARLYVVAPHYRAVGDELLNLPAPGRFDTDGFYEPFIGSDPSGRPVAVGWIWRRGQVLGASTAIVYSPGWAATTTTRFEGIEFSAGRVLHGTCRPLIEEFSTCPFY